MVQDPAGGGSGRGAVAAAGCPPRVDGPTGAGARFGERALSLGPVALLAGYLGVFLLVRPDVGLAMLRILPLQLVPLGSESSVAVLVFQGMPLPILLAFLCMSDLATSMPFLVCADALQRLPLVGGLVTAMRSKGSAFHARHGWLQRLGPLGLLVFVAVPLSGTGTTVGVLVGRVAGFGSYAIAGAVMAGTLLRWGFVVGGIALVGLLL